uniref:Uncharacterized protein n=1 Tax=Photinus pyralis TaxID=7054 RepID=A0A1Y1LTA9_PHOPY
MPLCTPGRCVRVRYPCPYPGRLPLRFVYAAVGIVEMSVDVVSKNKENKTINNKCQSIFIPRYATPNMKVAWIRLVTRGRNQASQAKPLATQYQQPKSAS